MKKLILILTGLVLIFTACKKQTKDPDKENTSNSNSSASIIDSVITASNINYPVGTVWTYSIVTVDEQYVNIQSSNPNLMYSYTNTATYSVTVIRDTIIGTNITGKILEYSGPGYDSNTYTREVSYYDPADLKWHDISYIKYNGGPENVGCLGIDLPLKGTSKWLNTHTSHPSSGIDSCFAFGCENIACGLGSKKCIKFQYSSNTTNNVYWYNPVYGKVKIQAYNGQFTSTTYTSKASIITLTGYHN